MSVGPLPTRLVGFIEMEADGAPPARWEALARGAEPRATVDADRAADATCSVWGGRCRTTRMLADVTRLCDELQAEYERALRELDD